MVNNTRFSCPSFVFSSFTFHFNNKKGPAKVRYTRRHNNSSSSSSVLATCSSNSTRCCSFIDSTWRNTTRYSISSASTSSSSDSSPNSKSKSTATCHSPPCSPSRSSASATTKLYTRVRVLHHPLRSEELLVFQIVDFGFLRNPHLVRQEPQRLPGHVQLVRGGADDQRHDQREDELHCKWKAHSIRFLRSLSAEAKIYLNDEIKQENKTKIIELRKDLVGFDPLGPSKLGVDDTLRVRTINQTR